MRKSEWKLYKSYLHFCKLPNHDLLRHTAVAGPDGNVKRSRLLQISNVSVMPKFVIIALVCKRFRSMLQ